MPNESLQFAGALKELSQKLFNVITSFFIILQSDMDLLQKASTFLL